MGAYFLKMTTGFWVALERSVGNQTRKQKEQKPCAAGLLLGDAFNNCGLRGQVGGELALEQGPPLLSLWGQMQKYSTQNICSIRSHSRV